MRTIGTAILLWLVVLTQVCMAQSSEQITQLMRENEALRQRIDHLESELSAIKNMLQQSGIASPAIRNDPATVPSPAPSPMTTEKKIAFKPYGYIKLDAAYDTARVDTGNFVRWVEPNPGGGKDDEFNMTANETRVGVKLEGPQIDRAQLAGLIEVDFYGSGGTENKPQPFLRHAYFSMDWPDSGFALLAGQTWDVISPLSPETLNYSGVWWAGNIGYRRPQVRLSKRLYLSPGWALQVAGAVSRTIGQDGPFDPGDTGEDAGFPGVQGRAALSFPGFGRQATEIGISGHYAKEEYDQDSLDNSREMDSWSANLDLSLPLYAWLSLKGELFCGQNLSTYLGGIGQGVDSQTLLEVGSYGGWLAARLTPWERWRFNLGFSEEVVDAQDLSDPSARVRNGAIFGNTYFRITEQTEIAGEVSRWKTRYKGLGASDSLRFQTSLIYRF